MGKALKFCAPPFGFNLAPSILTQWQNVSMHSFKFFNLSLDPLNLRKM